MVRHPLSIQHGKDQATVNKIKVKAPVKGKIYNILDYGAKGDTLATNTRAIQAAINACTAGGTV